MEEFYIQKRFKPANKHAEHLCLKSDHL
jgi:hypothetical protein